MGSLPLFNLTNPKNKSKGHGGECGVGGLWGLGVLRLNADRLGSYLKNEVGNHLGSILSGLCGQCLRFYNQVHVRRMRSQRTPLHDCNTCNLRNILHRSFVKPSCIFGPGGSVACHGGVGQISAPGRLSPNRVHTAKSLCKPLGCVYH